MPVIQRASGRIAVPWRNGRGAQYEVTADGPLPDDWSWRLATADIPHDAPFSVIPGVSREFCVATGNGVILTIDGVSYRCGPGSITPFDGGAAVKASTIDGPTRAVNLMVKHGSPLRRLGIHLAGEGFGGVEALVAIGGVARLTVDDQIIELGVLDAVLNLGQSVIFIAQGAVVAVRSDSPGSPVGAAV